MSYGIRNRDHIYDKTDGIQLIAGNAYLNCFTSITDRFNVIDDSATGLKILDLTQSIQDKLNLLDDTDISSLAPTINEALLTLENYYDNLDTRLGSDDITTLGDTTTEALLELKTRIDTLYDVHFTYHIDGVIDDTNPFLVHYQDAKLLDTHKYTVSVFTNHQYAVIVKQEFDDTTGTIDITFAQDMTGINSCVSLLRYE